ncbi:Plasmodium exported protein, unknown function [Plasmodium ovale wallikeri]|uniref:Uncharacterized protein n=1 Tax=Plasmodium ovale wallikeri TaxID=864142 RepID=A0A1A8YK83_PLAOA|nr:Plasmodium exported protein, unknown function [Plasmodium ovale wallikeri]
MKENIYYVYIRIITHPDVFTLRYERLLAQKDEKIWKQRFIVTVGQGLTTTNSGQDEKGTSQKAISRRDIEQLRILCRNTSKVWKDMIEEMESTYVEKTKNMDNKWTQNMWDKTWAKYLENVHMFISSKLNNESFSLRDKQKIIDTSLQWTKADFNIFLRHVNDRWNKNIK